MSDDMMAKEYPDQKQRLAIAYAQHKETKMSNAAYPWDECIKDQLKEYDDQKQAEKVCGSIKAHGNRNGALMILNRDFKLPSDGWYHIAPKGEYAHKPSNVVQVIDDKAIAAMVNRFAEDAKASNFPGILVDFDHFSQDGDKPSEAAGWIQDLQNRADGLWAKVQWSDVGEQAVKGGRYRLVSPVWLRSDCEQLGNGRVRPMRLDTVALTNDPNLKGLTPLSNRAGRNVKAEEQIPLTTRARLTYLANAHSLKAFDSATNIAAAKVHKAAAALYPVFVPMHHYHQNRAEAHEAGAKKE